MYDAKITFYKLTSVCNIIMKCTHEVLMHRWGDKGRHNTKDDKCKVHSTYLQAILPSLTQTLFIKPTDEDFQRLTSLNTKHYLD